MPTGSICRTLPGFLAGAAKAGFGCCPTGRPFMPVEFAVAAYRFGSLIRPFYVLNDTGVVDIFGPAGGRNLNVRPPHPGRPGDRLDEHPSRRSELPGPEAAQD